MFTADDPGQTSPLLARLRSRERRGSKPRCHLLTAGGKDEVARRITALIAPRGCVSAEDAWMPAGFDAIDEAQLHNAERLIPSAADRRTLLDWWLAEPRPTSTTPSWDIASTCSIDGRPGLLLVEAKAHEAELVNESCGKRVNKGSSGKNHQRIAAAIEEANASLRLATGKEWHLSRDRCYQMSNRFAWAWKLCTLGYSVALVYFGFIGAVEMAFPFRDADQWSRLVYDHSASLIPRNVWGEGTNVSGVPLLPLIRATRQALA